MSERKAAMEQLVDAMAERYVAEMERVKAELIVAFGPLQRVILPAARTAARLMALFDPRPPVIKHRRGPRSYRKRWPR